MFIVTSFGCHPEAWGEAFASRQVHSVRFYYDQDGETFEGHYEVDPEKHPQGRDDSCFASRLEAEAAMNGEYGPLVRPSWA